MAETNNGEVDVILAADIASAVADRQGDDSIPIVMLR